MDVQPEDKEQILQMGSRRGRSTPSNIRTNTREKEQGNGKDKYQDTNKPSKWVLLRLENLDDKCEDNFFC